MRSGNKIYSPVRQFAAKLLVTFLFLLLAAQAHAQDTLAAIAHEKGAPSSLSKNELKSVLLGERQRWSNGTKVVIALMKTNNELGETISRNVFNMKPDELNKHWLALVFQGKASAPNFFNSVSELESFVSQNPGAIGITNQPVSLPNIKTITVDRKETL
ncbi:hypothetical protein ACFS7Z_16320 [Pontibacter toksunensis]|uniref:PBP superfamily domain-containing protein n=1 Tax=Pontibacter toksunensis TaxID=1332631 RepID=A0ABW6BW12_9BACT